MHNINLILIRDINANIDCYHAYHHLSKQNLFIIAVLLELRL